MAEEFPSVNTEECIGCGGCVGACPASLFELVDDKAHFKVDDKDSCVHCGSCVAACPNSAISMKPL